MHITTRLNRMGLLLLLLLPSVTRAAYNPLGNAANAANTRKPNIVFILADDLGWMDTSYYGSKYYRTPHIDALTKRGMTFTRAYTANPLCSPTRASLLTGLDPARLGLTAPAGHVAEVKLQATMAPQAAPQFNALQANSATRLGTNHFTLAKALKAAGYATGHFGKWHLGSAPYSPLQQGFDVDVPNWPGPGPAGSFVAPWKFPTFKGQPGEHLEDRMAQEASRYIVANKDKPFFLNYWAFSVHAPFDAKQSLIEKYRPGIDETNPQHSPTYAAMVESLDDAVGTLVKTLDEQKLTDNTLLIFYSDNGGNMYDKVDKTTPTSNAPLRGGKATIYEGGTRVPLIVSWPGKVQPGTASEAMVSSIDFYPTLLDALNLRAKPDQKFDGISILPALQGKALARDTIFCHFPHYTPATGARPSTYVHQGEWKLIRFYADNPDQSDRFELYNLRDDVGESRNLAAATPAKVQILNALITQYLRDKNVLVPQPNPNFGKQPAPQAAGNAGNPASGWKAVKDVKLSVANGTLNLTSSGVDPFIVSDVLPAAIGPYSVELRMRSALGGELKIFWSTPQKRVFQRENSIEFPAQVGSTWSIYTVKLLVAGAIRSIRFDPGTSPGEAAIDWIRVRDGQGKTLRVWEFD